jgi:hypothetical protein
MLYRLQTSVFTTKVTWKPTLYSFLALSFTILLIWQGTSCVQADTGTWTATGNMRAARLYHTATLLPNGKVLVVGGRNSADQKLASAELYDPATGQWSNTGNMSTPRSNHTATLLPNGKVLVVGGVNANGLLISAEIYNPVTATWTTTGSMNAARCEHVATLMTSGPLAGKVLVASGGGCAGPDLLTSTELYDPSTGTWSYTGNMILARYWDPPAQNVQFLPDGSVFIVGGTTCCGYYWINEAEMFNPVTQTWTATTGKTTTAQGSSIVLNNGQVLVAGGRSNQGTVVAIASAELFNPATHTWMATKSMSQKRYGHSLIRLQNGQVLTAGGNSASWGGCNVLSSAEIYDPTAGKWTATGAMITGQDGYTATLLSNGKVLIAGGGNCNGLLSTAELYTPAALNPPTGLHVIPLSPSNMQLSWGKTSGALAYRLQRKTGNCSSTNAWGTRVDVSPNVTSFGEDTGLQPNTTYSYQIAAYYGSGSFSDYSACVSATTSADGAPNMPSSLKWQYPDRTTAQSLSSNEVLLGWDDDSADETGFAIYRKTGTSGWAQVGTTEANTQAYTDNTAAGNTDSTSYAYDVRACNATGCSKENPYPPVVPFAPTNLAATVGTAVGLTWHDASDNETSFEVSRKNGNCASANPTPWTVLDAKLAPGTQSYADGSAVAQEGYSYRVRAVYDTALAPRSLGYSGYSNCVTTTAP